MQERLDKLYDRFTDIEKKTFMKSFLADVNIYEEEQADGSSACKRMIARKSNIENNINIGFYNTWMKWVNIFEGEIVKSIYTVNACDYDQMVLYKSGEFNCKYKTNICGKLKQVEKQELPDTIKKSFLDSKYGTYETIEDIILYRVFGKYIGKNTGKEYGAQMLGSYATTEFSESIIDAKNRLALLPQWKNTKMYEAKFCLPKGNVINVGIAAPQPLDKKTFPGGAEQIILPKVSKEEMNKWVLGYRRIGARQLTKVPSYPFTSVEEVVDSMKLYSSFCPECQCLNIHKIQNNEKEQYTFVGSKGGIYTMQYMCLNPLCGYMW